MLKNVEAFPDPLTELRGGLGVALVLVRGSQLVEQELLATGETVRLILEALNVGRPVGAGGCCSRSDGRLEELAALRAEDVVFEEGVDGFEHDALADPDRFGVGGVPVGVLVLIFLGLAGVARAALAVLAVHTVVAQCAEEIGRQDVGAISGSCSGAGRSLLRDAGVGRGGRPSRVEKLSGDEGFVGGAR
ncbi:hypothetical protein ACGFZQ_02245 [Streptomyces sp. NPDC048254]|uniref:hypothetical protein n=1 Tax=Streptomyces sp. NPDC048254 TaxID=3365525 RepID=UPI003714F106